MLLKVRAWLRHLLAGAEWCAIPMIIALVMALFGGLKLDVPLVLGALAETTDNTRIVSIGGSITEIVYALGFQSRIVGVDTTSLYPPDALRNTPRVGYMRALSAEGILSLKPSFVIAIDGSGPPAALKLVTDAGVPLTFVHEDPSPEGVAAKIQTVGSLLGDAAAAEALAKETRSRFALLESMRAKVVKPARVLFLLSLQNGKPMVGGRDTAADAIIKLAGAVNAADDIDGFKQITDEGVIAASPDIILKMTNGNLVGAADEIFSLPAFAATPAAAKRALIAMDGLYLLGFGPRTPDAVRDLMVALYPDLSLPPLPTATERR
jgi:iron complex transport system substrate-binding protein